MGNHPKLDVNQNKNEKFPEKKTIEGSKERKLQKVSKKFRKKNQNKCTINILNNEEKKIRRGRTKQKKKKKMQNIYGKWPQICRMQFE